ncbi:GIY-YIG nuclease family protein [Paraferrimonas sp. SM1919]|uniref:GIY-YIG nuclease family protein n=1 Tax=Paraferrimonas sp. SM1919 TaxID=2662263 RepID=UPI0013D33E6D|nr:GIY-YIG nuclease family protein [Paraferrimonas sp. SM1919]
MSTWSVYLVRSANNALYCGISTNPQRRLSEHQSKPQGAKALKGKGPLSLVFSAEVGDRSQASKVEYQLKRLHKTSKEKLVAEPALFPEYLHKWLD